MADVKQQTVRKAVVAGTVGNIMEWYDFGVYGYFAPVISTLFFPTKDALTSLLLTFVVFGVGFIMRPVGALIFGHYGDRAGRRNALAFTVILMGIATFLIGVMPSYEKIGVLAPILLTLARLAQGLSAGGEWGGSTSFIVEYANESKRGYIGSWQQFSVGAGLLLGSAMGALLTNTMSKEALYAWGWRVPFLVGLLIAFIGLYLRYGIEETPKFKEVENANAKAKAPLIETLRTYPKEILIALGFTVCWTVSYYVFLTFMPTYVSKILKVPLSLSLISNTVGLLLFIALVPLMGALSDRIGRKPLLLASCLGFVVLTYPLFIVLGKSVFALILLVQLIFAILLAMFSGPGPAAIAEIFPTKVRYSALSIGYNISVAGFGGTAPFISTYLISATGNNLAPTYYVIAGALVSLLVIFAIRETYKEPLK